MDACGEMNDSQRECIPALFLRLLCVGWFCPFLIPQGSSEREGVLQGPHPKDRCPFHFSSCLSAHTQYVHCVIEQQSTPIQSIMTECKALVERPLRIISLTSSNNPTMSLLLTSLYRWRMEAREGEDRGLGDGEIKELAESLAVVLDLRWHLRRPTSRDRLMPLLMPQTPLLPEVTGSWIQLVIPWTQLESDWAVRFSQRLLSQLSSPHLPNSKFQSFPQPFVSYLFPPLSDFRGLNQFWFSSVCQIHSHEVLVPGRGSETFVEEG